MSIIWFPVGLALPTIIGWLALRLVEANTPVLLRIERWLLASVLGVTLMSYLAFLVWWTGFIRYSFLGLLSVQLLIIFVLGGVWMHKRNRWCRAEPEMVASVGFSKTQKVLLCIIGIWIAVKVIAGFAMLTATPPYIDDVYNNWNMRGKLYYYTQEHVTSYITQNEALSVGGTLSYPTSVPLFKTWLTYINGSWDEGLVNAVHMWWYVVAIVLMYYGLRRKLSKHWSAGGAYLLASLPLYLMHGTIAYADLYLSLHIFAALMPLIWALWQPESNYATSCLRVSSLVIALLIYTKNEALILHLPAMIAIYGSTLWYLNKIGTVSVKRQLTWFIGILAFVLIPWIVFKWLNDLPFGNAKSVSSLHIKWHSGVVYAIFINTFLEGNWNLLFPVLFGLILWQKKEAFGSATTVLVAYFLLLYLGQMPIYLFTGIAYEALNQTGYARGLIQLTPITVAIVTLLTYSAISDKSREFSSVTTHNG